MSKPVLNLKLHYKGKLLDVARYGRDFTKKLYIGSSKYLFWQILDSRFPLKHLFLTWKDGHYFFNLLPGMDISFREGNQDLDKEALRQRNLLQGNLVKLSPDMTGTVQVDHHWTISYEYKEPYVTVYTDQEKQIISQYARRAELQPFQKFTRNMLLAALAVSILALIVFDAVKPDYTRDYTLEERWKQMQSVATKVEVPPAFSDQFAEEPSTGQISEQTQTGPATGTPTGTMSRQAAQAALAGLFGTDGGGSGAYAVTTEEDIIAFALGGGKGGSGGGSGPGPGGKGTGAGAGGTGLPGFGDGSGYGSVFNPSEIPSGTTNLAGLSSGRPTGKLSTQAPAGDVTTFVGNAQRISPLNKPATRVSSSVVTRFSGPSVKKVAEGGITSAPADTRPELQRIEQRVARYKPQIKDLYNRFSQIKSMYGTMRFLLYIDSDGSVAGVQITPLSGEFYPEFMTQLEQLIKGWRFDNKNLVPYEFLMTFTK